MSQRHSLYIDRRRDRERWRDGERETEREREREGTDGVVGQCIYRERKRRPFALLKGGGGARIRSIDKKHLLSSTWNRSITGGKCLDLSVVKEATTHSSFCNSCCEI